MRIVEAKDLPMPKSATPPPQRYLIGLDLGSDADYSALSILEQHGYGKDAN